MQPYVLDELSYAIIATSGLHAPRRAVLNIKVDDHIVSIDGNTNQVKMSVRNHYEATKMQYSINPFISDQGKV